MQLSLAMHVIVEIKTGTQRLSEFFWVRCYVGSGGGGCKSGYLIY